MAKFDGKQLHCYLFSLFIFRLHVTLEKRKSPEKQTNNNVINPKKNSKFFHWKKSRPFIGQHCENLSLKGINGKSHVHYMSLHLFCVNSHRMVINGAPFKSHCVYVSCSLICIHSLAMVALTRSTMFFFSLYSFDCSSNHLI